MTTERIQRILVSTDLSDFSKAAAAWAAMFHRCLGSRVTLLYANQPYVPVDILGGPTAYALQTHPEFRQSISEGLSAFATECFPDFVSSVDTLLVDDAPAHAIVDMANTLDADLILWERTAGAGGDGRSSDPSPRTSFVRPTGRS